MSAVSSTSTKCPHHSLCGLRPPTWLIPAHIDSPPRDPQECHHRSQCTDVKWMQNDAPLEATFSTEKTNEATRTWDSNQFPGWRSIVVEVICPMKANKPQNGRLEPRNTAFLSCPFCSTDTFTSRVDQSRRRSRLSTRELAKMDQTLSPFCAPNVHQIPMKFIVSNTSIWMPLSARRLPHCEHHSDGFLLPGN